ncbi:hypothetical protein DXG01_002220 [Tephrocybe rancida]|nr:hypothetical protein DXG01_002220 [Tephrocybe rancida]
MPLYPNHSRSNTLTITPDALRRSYEKTNASPVTPAVTGIIYPSTPLDSITEADTSIYHNPPNHFYTHPNVAASTIDRDDGGPRPLSAGHSMDKLWGTIRQQKERKMAKEKPKVQSLEEIANDLSSSEPHPIDIPVMDSRHSDPKSLKKRKSMYVRPLVSARYRHMKSGKLTAFVIRSSSSFRESSDGRMTVATFDLHNVNKQDIHVSFQRNRLIVTWAIAEISEWEDKGVVYRERLERHYNRTLPLAEGTKFEEIRGIMSERQLTLRYPIARCVRAEPRSRSGDS